MGKSSWLSVLSSLRSNLSLIQLKLLSKFLLWAQVAFRFTSLKFSIMRSLPVNLQWLALPVKYLTRFQGLPFSHFLFFSWFPAWFLEFTQLAPLGLCGAFACHSLLSACAISVCNFWAMLEGWAYVAFLWVKPSGCSFCRADLLFWAPTCLASAAPQSQWCIRFDCPLITEIIICRWRYAQVTNTDCKASQKLFGQWLSQLPF